MPCIGVAKTMHVLPTLSPAPDVLKEQKKGMARGDVCSLYTINPDFSPEPCVVGAMLVTSANTEGSHANPLYVSVGHRISLASAIKIVMACCKYRIPEPIRRADMAGGVRVRSQAEEYA
jgi:deoxyinosine 3'endonuclease (endonuclease V)